MHRASASPYVKYYVGSSLVVRKPFRSASHITFSLLDVPSIVTSNCLHE